MVIIGGGSGETGETRLLNAEQCYRFKSMIHADSIALIIFLSNAYYPRSHKTGCTWKQYDSGYEVKGKRMGKMLNLNGRMFLFGGETINGSASDEVFVFNGGNDGGANWEPQRLMLHPRSYHTAVALPASFLFC